MDSDAGVGDSKMSLGRMVSVEVGERVKTWVLVW